MLFIHYELRAQRLERVKEVNFLHLLGLISCATLVMNRISGIVLEVLLMLITLLFSD